MRLYLKVSLVLLLALIAAPRGDAGYRYNQVITIIAGTPIQVSVDKLIVNSVMVTPKIGSSAGIIYVMHDILPRGRTPSTSNTGDVATQLCPATATVPGCVYSDPIVAQQGNDIFVDLSLMWIDGSHSGDTVIVSYATRN